MKLAIADRRGVRVQERDHSADSLGTANTDTATLGVLASDDLLLHRLPLQGATPAERLEEARMRAVDLAAQPLEDLHVAVGAPLADGSSWVALIGRPQMAAHLAEFEAAGIDPQWLVPAALCLPEPDPAFARIGPQLLFRTADLAGIAEPELFAALSGIAAPADFTRLAEFEPDLSDEIPLDLRQGEFAPRIRWWLDRRFRIMALALLGLLLLLLLAPPLWQQRQTTRAIAGMDAEVLQLAARAGLPPAANAAQAATRLDAARKAREGAALGPRLSFAASAVDAAPGAYIDGISLAGNGDLQLQLGGSAEGINLLSERLNSGPFETDGHGAQFRIGGRSPYLPGDSSALAGAAARLANASRDTAILELLQASAGSMDLQSAIVAADLSDAQIVDTATGRQLTIPAVRARVLLPLVARLADSGLDVTGLAIQRNADATLNARLEIQP